ncbi:hypothetical protein [Isoptericola sp. NPDC055881]
MARAEREGNYLVRIEKTNGRELLVLFCNEYMVSLETLDDALNIAPNLSAIVTSSAWNRYSREAKEEGKQLGIGVFRGPEILGALHKDGGEFLEHLSRDQLDAIRRGHDPY